MAEKNPKVLSARDAYSRLWNEWLKEHSFSLAITFVLMFFVAISAAGYAKFIQLIISAFETNSASVIWWGPVGIISLAIIKGMSQYIQLLMQNRILSRVQANLQYKMFNSLVHMDLANLLAESPAALATRFSADIELIRGSTNSILGSITAILTIIATFGVMLSIDWTLTISLIFIFLLAFGPVGIVGAKVRKISVSTQKEIAHMTESVNEGLAGIRMVRTYRLEKRLSESAFVTFERLFKLRLSIVKWQSSVSPLMEILGAIAIGLLLLLVALRMQVGAIDLAGFIGLLTALGVATNPSRKLGGAYASALQGIAALERVYELFDTPNKIKDGSFSYSGNEKSEGNLIFSDVDFTYPDGYQALHSINLNIEAGKSYAFVGRSGAGKSTIFNLLSRLFDSTKGQISLDGRSLLDYKVSTLRDQISVVSQDSILLTGTVLDNIGFGREGASREDCISAAKASAANAFITKLKDGYDTKIDPSKIKFSGGEKQRLSIARAILRDSPILLLDEPTSALDAQSENQIRKALDELSKNRTTLIIAHRLSTILDADQIIVMDQGKIVDQGTHAELLARGGIYAELFNLQFDMSPKNDSEKRNRSFSGTNKSNWSNPLFRLSKFLGL
ncbi:ABC transporter ATP-binding protein/permease [Amylibacter sp.]|nr:ABC transporter ATP-binding protein/permease [Amylibacter sp.]MDC1264412.1 ABC transporter ATP-binding protein/permease [Amylibacter sp.]